MKPKNRAEALELMCKLSKEFNFDYVVIDEDVFKDESVRDETKHWTDAQIKER
jgi:hypothetical protein